MRTIALLVLLGAGEATAGVYGRLGGGSSSPPTPSDCSRQKPTGEPIPAWSRLSWSVGFGWASRRFDDAWHTAFAIVPRASYALWAREGQCQSGNGFFRDDLWRRVSLGISLDAVWRTSDDEPLDFRPGLRLARATFASGLLSVGSNWVPTWELAVTAGPTFDPAWSGGAIAFGARASIFSLELRVAARTESRGQEVMVLLGLTDLHGLWTIGQNRTLNID